MKLVCFCMDDIPVPVFYMHVGLSCLTSFELSLVPLLRRSCPKRLKQRRRKRSMLSLKGLQVFDAHKDARNRRMKSEIHRNFMKLPFSLKRLIPSCFSLSRM